MKTTYSGAFIEQSLVKVFSRGDRTIRSVAEDLNISFYTLKNWMKRKSVGKYREWRTLQHENDQLRRELVRKEKALAEAAALTDPAKKVPRALGGRGNPFSESLFKTLKYRPAYPRRPFENLIAARQWSLPSI